MGPFQCLVLFSLSSAATAASEGWCYPSQQSHSPGCAEPRKWGDLYPACGGKSQSPINIVTDKVKIDWNLEPFKFTGYEKKQTVDWNITNNGHSVQVNLDGSAEITSGGLQGLYRAAQFHFHWGQGWKSQMEPGSEHTINGERSAMELHIVHIKDEYYPNITAALASQGVAVLGFLVEIGAENKNYLPLISELKNVSAPGNETQMTPLPLSSLIPPVDKLNSYYRYNGSLTTPDCSEGVTWTLFEKPINLSLQQVQDFWLNLYFNAAEKFPMENNFRPAQPLGDRTVYKSDSTALFSPAKTLLLLPAATYLLLSLTQ